jgi:hypothetical protein
MTDTSDYEICVAVTIAGDRGKPRSAREALETDPGQIITLKSNYWL